MKRWSVVIGIIAAIAIISVAITQAQRPGGQPGMMRRVGALQVVESKWAAIAFEIKVDDKTLKEARPHFQKAWDEQKKLRESSAGDFQAIVDGMEKIAAELDAKLKDILTDEQLKKLTEWEESQQRPQRMGGGAPGGRDRMR